VNDPRHYIDEIRQNLNKMRAQGAVTPTENALFGMIDGLAGLHLVTLERVTRLEQLVGELGPEEGPVVEVTRPDTPGINAPGTIAPGNA
jgi:hypothetical protein